MWLALGVLLHACQKPESDSGNALPEDDLDRTAVLENLVDNIVVPRSQSFQTAASELKTAVDAYCAASDGSTDQTTTLAAAQAAFKTSMISWQYLEMMVFGPLLSHSSALRNAIYSWDFIDHCGVDREVVASAVAGYSLSSSDNRKGLDALSYLLFDDDLNHACLEKVSDTAHWNTLTDASKRSGRCTYLKILAADMSTQGDLVVTSWQAARDGFVDGSTHGGLPNTLNQVSDALYYLDQEVKGLKLALPAGINDICKTASCPELEELPLSKVSKEAIVANISAFQEIISGDVHGVEGKGFSDLMTDLGSQDVADELLSLAASFLSHMAANTEDKTMAELATGIVPSDCSMSTVSHRKVELCSLHADLKKITDLIKTDFLKILNLNPPKRAAGDAD